MRDFFEHLLLLVLVLVAVTATANTEKSLKIADYTSVAPGKVTLGHMVDMTNLDLSDEILNIEFGVAPLPGEKITFSNRAISQGISRFISSIADEKQKEKYTKLKITIPNDIIVQGEGWESSLVMAERNLRRSIELLCNMECEIENFSSSKIPYNDAYTLNARVAVDGFKVLPKGSFNIPFRVVKNGMVIDNGWIQGNFRIVRNAAVAKRVLNAGWHLQSSDFEIRKVDVTMETDTAADVKALIGSKLARTLNPNQVILNSMIARESDVVFGQSVKAIVREEEWQVSIDGVARDNGNIGDRIKVYNPATKKTLMGVLTAKGIVEIR